MFALPRDCHVVTGQLLLHVILLRVCESSPPPSSSSSPPLLGRGNRVSMLGR